MHTDHLRRALAASREAELARTARAALLAADAAPVVRPVARGDDGPLGDFFAGLSPVSRHRRFLAPLPRVAEHDLVRFTDVDHRTDDGLLALRAGDGRVLGFSQYASWAGRPGVADFAIAVADEWHGRGLGLRLGAQLVDRARAQGIATLTATTLVENAAARRLLGRLGFARRRSFGPEVELALAL
jgi:acetyltransferase